jgi:hypothetical protein
VAACDSPSNAEWLARQLTEACGWDELPRYLIRDRDGAYGASFIRRIRAMGIRDRPVSARSAWQNGYAERLIGSIRRECLDHVVVVGERHLRHVLASYQTCYNEVRTHRSLQKDAPVRRDVCRTGRVFVADLGRATPSICSSLSFRQGQPVRFGLIARSVAQNRLRCRPPRLRTRKILDDLYQPRVPEGTAVCEAGLTRKPPHGIVGEQDIANQIARAERPRQALHRRKQQRTDAPALPNIRYRQGDFAALSFRRDDLDRLGDDGRASRVGEGDPRPLRGPPM